MLAESNVPRVGVDQLPRLSDSTHGYAYNKYNYMAQRTTLGEFKVVKKLGQGAFGEVFLVKDGGGNLFAAKVLKIIDKKSADSIVKELSIHGQLKHENLVRAYKAGLLQDEQCVYLVMEYCEQGSLASHIGRLKSIEIKARLMLEIALGVEYMHNTKSVIHRDLKPDNILIKENTCKIADYGLSKKVQSYAQTKLGTPIYIAPELLLSDKYDFSVDIWSLGIIFLQILTNKRVVELIGPSIIVELPCQRQPFPTDTMLNMIESTTFRKLLVAMLNKNPSKRLNIKQVVEVIKSKFSNSGSGNGNGNENQGLIEQAAKLQMLAQLMRGLAVAPTAPANKPMPGKTVLTCEQNHELKKYSNLYGSDEYKCDNCKNNKKNDKEPSFNCQACKYDLCPGCCNLMEGQVKRLIMRASQKNKICPSGHELANFDSLYDFNSYRCKKCEQVKDNKKDKSFHCKQCKYDICPTCADKK